MRLRYLQLPRCGPLADTAIVFGREGRIEKTLNLPRKGALNFVVGVNGSGKSTLLRALYHIFRALKKNEFPALPLTLAWDVVSDGETVTAFLHIPEDGREKAFFDVLGGVQSNLGKAEWLALTNQLNNHPSTSKIDDNIKRGEDVLGSYLQAHLPKRLIAYTSGAADLWANLEQPTLHPREEEGAFQIEDERPQGWSMDREWEEEQPVRITNVLTRYALKSSGSAQTLPGVSGQVGTLEGETVERLRQELGPLDSIRRKMELNRQPRNDRLDDFYFRIQARHLRYAGITMALLQAAKELGDCGVESKREELRNALVRKHESGEETSGARRVLSEIDWFWPTHLSLVYHDADDRVSPRQHQELLCLVALADEVIAQPRGRHRAVFSLGPSDRISLTEKLKDAFPFGIPSKNLEFIAERVDGCKTGAEAILRVFSEDENLDSTLLDVFARLRDWERSGLLEDLTVTIKRLHRQPVGDGEPDDVLVTYDQLSDGEQMLLGRMGLLFLLSGQDGSLLLLDEPETHFNDVWKREIVDMVDSALLNSTAANVIISTHTSIALTDAFASEVTLLSKEGGRTNAESVELPLFGADPGRVLLRVFGASDMTGVRAARLLRAKVAQSQWTDEDKEALRSLIDETGSGWPRAKLIEILERLDPSDAAQRP